MKRKIKNILMIIILVLLIGSIYLTMSYAKNNVTNMENNLSSNDMGTPPDMNNGNSSDVPEKPDEEGSSSSQTDNQEPPEKPDGESSSSSQTDDQQPPEKPDGEDNNAPNGDMIVANDSTSQNNSINTNLSYIYYIIFAVEGLLISTILMYLILSKFNKKTLKQTFNNGDKVIIYILMVIILTVCITYFSGKITKDYFLTSSNNDSENSTSTTSVSYSSSKEITEDTTIDSGDFSSTEEDENAILVTGDIDVTLSNITVTKTGDSDGGDNTSFYGTNSAIIAKSGANLILKNITVTTDATGANGVFSYGGSATTNNSNSDGTTVTISDSNITTTKDNSGGIMTTGGGSMKASNLTINTSGTSSAAIRTDRGGGTVTVDGGTYTTNGQGSPSIYSTADITVSNASLISNVSEGIVVEGKNSVSIENTTLTDSNTKLNGQSTTYKNIFLYQSMSGDADTGNSEFTANSSEIITNNGDTFYVTNTTATINLTNSEITNNDSEGNFLRAQKDSWGTSGSNGADVTLNLTNQDATGNIVIDSISTLSMTMSSSSVYKGAINSENSAKSITLKLDKTSKITLTNDSYITSLDDSDETYSNIDFNGYKLYVNGVAIN